MVVQKIQFNLTQNKLDDIRIVQGDTCREILFEASDIDGVLSPEDYTYMFQMIKPDHTFVIQTLTDATLKVSEQMGAITGTSYYGIRITDENDELIYSGQGAFIVDDHVISDSDIESVAEVDGLVFPDDFATTENMEEIVEEVARELGFAEINDNTTSTTSTWSSKKIADELDDYTEINDNTTSTTSTWSSEKIDDEIADHTEINDNTTSTTSTWSSDKIANEISSAGGSISYSTTEHVIGTWIDGKTVYERSIDLGSFSVSSWGDHTIESSTNIAIMIDCEGYMIENNILYALPDPSVRIKVDANKNLIFTGTSSWNVTGGYITIRYTKGV